MWSIHMEFRCYFATVRPILLHQSVLEQLVDTVDCLYSNLQSSNDHPTVPAEILALLEQKQRFLQRWPVDSVRKSSCLAGPVKGAVRAYWRRKLEDLAGEVEQAVSRGEARATYAMVKRLARVQAPPRFTVRQKDGGEIGARRDALVTILGAERHRYLLRHLLNTKLRMRSGVFRSCQVERLVRAFGVEVLQIKISLEERLQSSGALDSVSLIVDTIRA